MTYWFPWKHPMARRRGIEVGVFDQTPRKWARRLGPTASPLDLLSSTKLPQPKHQLGLSGLAICLFGRLCKKTEQMSARPYGPCLSGVANAPGAHLRFTSQSRTCCTRLRPRRVSLMTGVWLFCVLKTQIFVWYGDVVFSVIRQPLVVYVSELHSSIESNFLHVDHVAFWLHAVCCLLLSQQNRKNEYKLQFEYATHVVIELLVPCSENIIQISGDISKLELSITRFFAIWWSCRHFICAVGFSCSDLLHIESNCRTPEKMALALLDYLFDRDTQACSNLSGLGRHGKKKLDPLFIYGLRCMLMCLLSVYEFPVLLTKYTYWRCVLIFEYDYFL